MTDTVVKDYQERLKELSTINKTVNILKEGRNVEETLQIVCNIIPEGWQYPEIASSRIIYDEKVWTSGAYKGTTKWKLCQKFNTVDLREGFIEVYYSEQPDGELSKVFLDEERNLISNLVNIIKGYLDGIAGKGVFKNEPINSVDRSYDENQHILNNYLNKINSDRDLYHDLEPYKIKDILLIASLFDTISLGLEGTSSLDLFEDYLNKYHSPIPRITGVSSLEEANNEMQSKNFDIVIILPGNSLTKAAEICKSIKSDFSYIPIYLLSQNSDIYNGNETPKLLSNFNSIFEWKGNSNIFFSIVKSTEDRVNISNDTKKGLVNVILVSDSNPDSYSKLLPVIYESLLSKILEMADKNLSDASERLLRLASRPKVIHVRDISEWNYYYEKYKDNIIAVIGDSCINNNGKLCQGFGLKLVENIRDNNPSLPALIYSSDLNYQDQALSLNAIFFDSTSESFNEDISQYIGHQIDNEKRFKIKGPNSLIRPANFEQNSVEIIRNLSIDKLKFHAERNHFSIWFRNKGLFEVAKQLQPIKASKTEDPEELRTAIIEVISSYSDIHNKGKVIPFTRYSLLDPHNIVRLSTGLLGGKGKGLAFLNSMLNTLGLNDSIDGIKIEIPLTTVIGSDEFDDFLVRNRISLSRLSRIGDKKIKDIFTESVLSDKLIEKLKIIVDEISGPIAVRSSASIEDSINTPFSGTFDTYMLPNNHSNIDKRVKQLSTAVKLVFASYFFENARKYMETVGINPAKEKMCVVIQQVVGSQHEEYFYPHISGIAQSYNYYPVSHMKPEDGFSSLALGLGINVVEGEKSFRFSPVSPDIDAVSTEDQIRDTQTSFYAIDLKNKSPELINGQEASLAKLDISVSEKHGTLKHLASVYRPDNQIISPGLRHAGPRILNFANILKYNYIPLARAINSMLNITEESLGCPSEIEFAVTLGSNGKISTFYLLQVVPLTGQIHNYTFNMEEIDESKMILKANKGMGNGEIDNIDTIVYLPPYNFNKLKTNEMAAEIGEINNELRKMNKKYLLIGPGRWGTRDKFIGIPVVWPQISNAKVIVEYSLKDFPLDASLGSHFFHNVTSNNIGYLSVGDENTSMINWKLLEKQGVKSNRDYFIVSQLKTPMQIRIDGKERIAAVSI